MRSIGIVLAGGTGSRMETDEKKQFISIGDRPLLAYSLESFNNSKDIDGIVVVCPLEDNTYIEKEIIKKYNISKFLCFASSGKERQDSVSAGLSTIKTHILKEQEMDCIVSIHDGARPLVSHRVIRNCVEGAIKYGAACACVKVKDTMKIADGYGNIKRTPPRENLYIAQTPQTFKLSLIVKAHENAKNKAVLGTDDASLVELMGETVNIVEGDYKNIKITTKEDINIFMEYLKVLHNK